MTSRTLRIARFIFISPRRIGEEIRRFEGILVYSARKNAHRSDISIIFALDALVFELLFGSSGFLLLCCFSAGQVSSCSPESLTTGVVEGSFSCSSSHRAAFKKRRDLPCISFLTIRLTASFRFWREISALKWWSCNSREMERKKSNHAGYSCIPPKVYKTHWK